MASAVPMSWLERFRTEPLATAPLIGLTVVIWIAGALYCSGYERLASGLDNWPGSLWWSAIAVLPWLALFEYSKSLGGRDQTRSPARLALILAGTAALSLALEYGANLTPAEGRTPVALALMRRLPAIAVSLLLILWSRAGRPEAQADAGLEALAPSIDWIGAADNYIELRMAGRTAMRRMTMREAERALVVHGFVRIHRRYLVNRSRVAAVRGNGRPVMILADGTELPIGRAYASNLALSG